MNVVDLNELQKQQIHQNTIFMPLYGGLAAAWNQNVANSRLSDFSGLASLAPP